MGGVYILRPHAAGILYAPPLLFAPPPLEGYFQGWGWGCIKFGPVLIFPTPLDKNRSPISKEGRHRKIFGLLRGFQAQSQYLSLRKTRPPTRVFGPFGPEVPPEVPERVSPKSGVCLGVSEGVVQDPLSPGPKCVQKVT